MKQLKQIGGIKMTTTKKPFVPKYKYVDRYTRAGYKGKLIICPKCNSMQGVFHFSWSALSCIDCKAMVNKYDWKIAGAN